MTACICQTARISSWIQAGWRRHLDSCTLGGDLSVWLHLPLLSPLPEAQVMDVRRLSLSSLQRRMFPQISAVGDQLWCCGGTRASTEQEAVCVCVCGGGVRPNHRACFPVKSS